MKNLTKTLFKALILAIGVMPMMTSCFDADQIWDKIDKIEHRLDSLENSLNSQFQALNAIMDGQTTVTSCDKNADGSYNITLSNGAKFTVLANGTNYSALVSVTTVNGVKCWATYDANGKLVAIKDASGQPVPVVNEYKAQVEVVSEDGKFYIVIDGKRYMTGYDTEDLVQVFSSCERLTDASGNVYAMSFTFGDGIKVTVAVDGYNGVVFHQASSFNNEVITEYYVANGETVTLSIEKTGVIDYIMQIPDGWRVKEREDQYTGENYVDITAPAVATIEAGAAVAEGDLKIVAVVEGGKAAVSKLHVSTEAFKVFDVNGSKAVIEPYNGVHKYVYGIVAKSEYNESTLYTTVSQILKSSDDAPAGYVVAEAAVNARHEDTFGKNLTNNAEYVFWAVPALYNDNDDDAGFYVKEGTFRKYDFKNVSVKFTKANATLFDAELEITFDGVKKIYAGTSKKYAGLYSEITRLIEYEAITPVTAPATYKGLASAFPNAAANEEVEFEPGTTYVTWVVPAEEGKTVYTTNDIISTEFTTKSIVAGSSLKVTLGSATTDRTSISIPVVANGAEIIYYAYMSKTEGDRISGLSNNDKAEVILEHDDCVCVRGASATATVEKVTPNTTMWLYAVSVDSNGKYGQVNSMTATTGQLNYSETLTVKVTEGEISAEYATMNIAVEGGEAADIIYWFGKSTDNFWVNSKLLGGSKDSAQQYMALYPQDENIVKVMNRHGKVGADGKIKFTGLARNCQYILVACAKDKNGNYSKAGYKMIVTLSADLGNIVREGSDKWNAAKSAIEIGWKQDRFYKGSSQGYSSYGFTYTGPTEYTAFILCGTLEYFEEDKSFQNVEDRIIEIEKNAARRYDSQPTLFDANGEYLNEPNWYDGEGNVHSGGMAIVSDYYVHGYPKAGYVAYLAAGGHDAACGADCPNYTAALEAIQSRLGLDWYINKFSGYYVMKGAEDAVKRAAEGLRDFYYPYYKDKTPIVYVNDGSALDLYQPYGVGLNDSGVVVDDVLIVLKDKNGNYYEPMVFPVPNYFK